MTIGLSEDAVDVAVFVGGQTWGKIQKKTGILKMSGTVQ